MPDSVKAPKWFDFIAICAVLWNLVGVLAFAAHIMTSPEDIAKMPAAEQALYQNIPVWVTFAFAIAVFAGLLGSLGLLLKKAYAKNAFMLSLAGVIVQDIYSYLMIDTIGVYGSQVLIMPLLVFSFTLGFIWLAVTAQKRNWLAKS